MFKASCEPSGYELTITTVYSLTGAFVDYIMIGCVCGSVSFLATFFFMKDLNPPALTAPVFLTGSFRDAIMV